MRKLYYALIHPYFNYCIEAWGHSADYLVNSLFLLQKRSIRSVSNSHYLAHSGPIFEELGILKLGYLYKFNIALYVFKTLNIPLFDIGLCNYIAVNVNNHNHATRNLNSITIPRVNFERTRNSINYMGCNVWNNLDSDLKSSDSVLEFKGKLKRQLVNSQNSLVAVL